MRRPALAGILLVAAACGSGPLPSPSTAPTGFVEITLEIVPDATQFFGSQHRAQVVDAAGAVLAEWEITDARAPVAVPVGALQLRGFTVFLSDFIECSPDPAAPGKDHCEPGILGPATTCAIPIEVTAGSTVLARYRSLPQGGCELVGLPAPSAT